MASCSTSRPVFSHSSGTMANLLAIATHCDERGSEAIIGDKSHVHVYEQGGMSSSMGVHS